MSNLLATAFGLAFTVFVCLYVAYALLGPWLHMRRTSTETADDTGNKHPARAQRATPFSPA